MRAAGALLSSARSSEALRAVLHPVGFGGDAVALTRDARDAFGLDERHEARLLEAGAQRLLLVLCGGASLRDELQRIGRRLAARAPHVPWMLAAARADGAEAALAAVLPGGGVGAARLAAFVWEPGRVVDSDAETLCALAAASGDDPLAHARLAEVLGRDALTRRFYRALQAHVTRMAGTMPPRLEDDDARHVALLYVSRLLFLRFLEAKGWLDGDRAWLVTRFDECMRNGGGFHRRVLLPLFFGTLNTPPSRRAPAARALGRIPFLNGGLFARSLVERRARGWTCPDAVMGALFDEVFQRYRFVAREDTATWSEASVDPEMLGRAFESLMAADDRRTGGVFYTPHALVARVADAAIAAALPQARVAAIRDVRVLDPACGSGAFLVYVLERLAQLRRDAGDAAPVAAIRGDVLARSVFGVDRNPTAVWLCELRLWLSVVIESDETDPARVSPLPNLDRNVRVGDAVAGEGFGRDPQLLAGGRRLERARAAYVRATGRRKQGWARALDRMERGRILDHLDRSIAAAVFARRELLAATRARDLFGERRTGSPGTRRERKDLRDRLRLLRAERRRIAEGGALPFSFAAFFAEAHSGGGFDIVVGNPPWVRLHRIPGQMRRRLRETYRVFREASWQSGATAAGAAAGFASQVDLAALFVERSVTLARGGGAIALLLPAKLWRSLAGGGVRRFLLEETRVDRLEDLSESRHAFDAAVYPSLLVARAGQLPPRNIAIAVHTRDRMREWTVDAASLRFDASPGAPWLFLPTGARAAFERLKAAGIPLADTAFGAARLGVKSGCNAAFVVRVQDMARGIASVTDSDGEHGTVELELLRPALRGDAVRPWRREPCDDWIVWTHDPNGAPLVRLPPRARAWLGRRYATLVTRSDAAHSRRWWSLFRTDAADHRGWRVVWADIGQRPRAAVLPPGDPTVPLNSCYVLPCSDETDAWALAALLNSSVAAAWLNAIAEPARGGYRRYMGWTVGLLPVPTDWRRGRTVLATARGAGDAELTTAVLEAFRLAPEDVAPLLEPSP